MTPLLDAATMELLWHDPVPRQERLRAVIHERLSARPTPQIEDAIVATYFFAFRTLLLEEAVAEISYHATIGVKNPPKGSLLEQCAAKPVGVDAFDATGRIGLLHIAFPLKMMLHPDGTLTSTDIFHTVAGAIIFDVFENQDAILVNLEIPEKVLKTFPGPAYGPQGVRQLAGFGPQETAFGTILKPTAGITPQQVGDLIEEVASCPLFLFVKEDEDLYPDLDYTPAQERTRQAVAAIARKKEERQGKGLIFAPHITSAPHLMPAMLDAVLEAGATGVMFNESFSLGTVRMVRERTRHLAKPPVIYGHNAGIGVRTRCIWRELIDLLARLEGIDFRQTAPVKPGQPFLLPYGKEWEMSEDTLTRPLPGIRSTMIVRAGGLDQGNLGLNMADAEKRGITGDVLFLAGSAINSIKNSAGKADPRLGAEAMQQAIGVHRAGTLATLRADEYLGGIFQVAREQKLTALAEALRQRYPNFKSYASS